MSDGTDFTLNGHEVTARPGETIWQVADRLGTEIPHLCHSPAPGYRSDGNCRACMVEIEGERVLAASCIRMPTKGMNVSTSTDRAKTARQTVFELLLTDQPEKVAAHDPYSRFWNWTEKVGVEESRFPARQAPSPDNSHPAMAVNLDACIHCNLCVRACREVQVNDVIGMAGRGMNSEIIFDFGDAMGESTCVACGECVQACPTGALMEATLVDDKGVGLTDPLEEVHSVCPYCGVGCQLTYRIKGQPHCRRARPGWARQPQSFVRQGPLRLRFCTPFPSTDSAPDQARRRPEGCRPDDRSRQSVNPFSRSELGRSLGRGGWRTQ